MNLTRTQIKDSAKIALSLIEKYRRDYDGINKDFKPEVIAEKRAEIYSKFSTAIGEHIAVLTHGADQLKAEREALTDPARHLVINGMAAAKDMTPGQAWLAQSFEKIPAAYVMDAIKEIDSDAVKLAAFMVTDTSTKEGKVIAAAILGSVEVDTAGTRSLAELEKEARKALFEYQDRPGAGINPAARMALGRQIDGLEKVAVPPVA